MITSISRTLIRLLVLTLLLSFGASSFATNHYKNFKVAVYIPAFTVEKMKDPAWLETTWNRIDSALKVDKVYIETHRNRKIEDEALIERVKKFFTDRGIEVAGGIAFVADEPNEFVTYCYSDPADREFVKKVVTVTAKHFDEIILDDFFFTTTKTNFDIAAKGNRSWTQYRLDIMRDAAKNLVLAPIKATNPKAKVVIKFPNWYEHFQGNGYDLDQEPKLFDGIYTGTETRDPERTDQQLQEYQSYQQVRFFDNIAPGQNGGGWVDIFAVRHADRYAEQLWNTMFAKAPEITLFYYEALFQNVEPGERQGWSSIPTSFSYEGMSKACCANGTKPVFAHVASDALQHADRLVGGLGTPIGLKSYKPLQSTGEDFIHNYLGMIGVPIDLSPSFPKDADVVLLTESAKFDQQIVEKIEAQLRAGKNVVITSGLLRALQGRGIENIAELEVTDRKLLADSYVIGRRGEATTQEQDGIIFPEIRFITNDTWATVRGHARGKNVPVLLRSGYSKGKLFVWNMPDNPTDLYRLPQPVLTSIKEQIAPSFPVLLDSPGKVALFVYDNNTVIVESYLDKPTTVKLWTGTEIAAVQNRETGEKIKVVEDGSARPDGRAAFPLTVNPHSFVVLSLEKK